MSFWIPEGNLVTVKLTGADPGKSLLAIIEKGIKLSEVEWKDELNVQFCCTGRKTAKIKQICSRYGDHLQIIDHKPILWNYLLERRLLLIGSIAVIFLTIFLPTRVMFFQVEGNQWISDREILDAAENCGIRFGSSRRKVRSEKMKNALLAEMPELKWAGINTSGCTAVISVRERMTQTKQKSETGIANIVSAKDGYITSCTVTKGNALCKPGQVVQEGQVLISGYTDCGICTQVTQAEGEVYAQTKRDVQVIMSSEFRCRTVRKGSKKKFSLVVGKKRINLWKDSGIWDSTCDRMYEEYYITLPGGFRLPLCLSVESVTVWDSEVVEAARNEVEYELKDFSSNSVLRQTVAGQIIDADHHFITKNGCYILKSSFLCSEMIGRVITEEIGELNGKTD